MIGDLLWTNDDLVLEIVDMLIKMLSGFRFQRDGAGRDAGEHPLLHKSQGRVLHDLGIHGQALKAAGGQALEHSVAHTAHAGLDGAQVFRQPPGGHLRLQKGHHIVADPFGCRRHGFKLGRLILFIGKNNSSDLFRRARDESRSDTVSRLKNVQRFGIGRQADLKDVVHAVQL